MKLTIYTDGASRGNPGPASYGFTISDEAGNIVHEKGEYIGITTNNVAEYSAVLKALEFVKNKLFEKLPMQIEVYADSKLVAEQLSGRYKVRAEHLKPIIEKIRKLILELGGITFTHIPRSQNSRADALANQALDNR